MKARIASLLAALVLTVVLAPAVPAQAVSGTTECRDGILRECWVGEEGENLGCVYRGTCTDEESTESGGRECTPSSTLIVVTCTGGLQACSRFYQCGEDGRWGLISEICYTSPECRSVACLAEGTPYWECWELPGSSTPCEDLNWGASGIQCEGMYDLNVSVSIPCQRVTRTPYPRGMVAVPNSLGLANSPGWNEAWSETLDYNACLQRNINMDGRKVRNFRIGLAWGRMDNMPPYWEIAGVGGFRGRSVTVVWERSSFGQPVCGPGLTAGQRLPAFPGRLYTYWTAYWRIQYQVQIDRPKCVYDWRCSVPGYLCAARCDKNGDGIVDAETIWEDNLCGDDPDEQDVHGRPRDECWRDEDSGWNPIDLRSFGYPTAYFVSRRSGPMPTALEPNPGCSGFCIPVIEVQGLIENPRR